MVVFTSGEEVDWAMVLLWRTPAPPPRRGPRPALDVDTIVATAIALADADGLAAVSMRAVGQRLGRSGMALYTYVPNKDVLIELMHDTVLGELPDSHDRTGGWRTAAEQWAAALRECLLRHPWLLSISPVRPVLGPNEYAMVESILAILTETGLDATTLRAAVGALTDFVRGAARTVAEARRAVAETKTSDEDWWQARTQALMRVAPDFAERFPVIASLESRSAPDQSEPPLDESELPLDESRSAPDQSEPPLDESELPLDESRSASDQSEPPLDESELPLDESRSASDQSELPLDESRPRTGESGAVSESTGGDERPYLERGAERMFTAGLALLLDGITTAATRHPTPVRLVG